MQSIYILLTKSDTYVSKTIGLATSDEYTHISISFSKSLEPMYSFSRKYINSPLPAGLRMEPLQTGFYKKYNYIPCALYELQVEDEVYQKAQCLVNQMYQEVHKYHFNVLGLVLCKMKIAYKRNDFYFCSEFVSEILAKSDAIQLPKSSSLMRPNDFAGLSEFNCLFKGRLNHLVQNRPYPINSQLDN